jgi:hypothetical protein
VLSNAPDRCSWLWLQRYQVHGQNGANQRRKLPGPEGATSLCAEQMLENHGKSAETMPNLAESLNLLSRKLRQETLIRRFGCQIHGPLKVFAKINPLMAEFADICCVFSSLRPTMGP